MNKQVKIYFPDGNCAARNVGFHDGKEVIQSIDIFSCNGMPTVIVNWETYKEEFIGFPVCTIVNKKEEK